MKFNILTLFPDIIHDYAQASILGRGQKNGQIEILAHNFRDFTLDKQHHVDDKPYGGGAGMVLQVEPIYRCLEDLGLVKNGKKIKQPKTKIIIMDPDGKKFDQKMAKQFSNLENLIIICGRYEGFDERIYKFVDEKVSVGDYVLAGGELPALTITEATARLIPGVLGNQESLVEETFVQGALECPQYTRPEDFMGLKVPKILLSGDHKKIKEWREKNTKRPD
ncbi:MAG: tRNA (guanine-N1)-methyltransferase [uncultured bacterium]|uniref:tRNA (guanine-N(1)-)-methyltransferase n=1 Tax=Candidatus Magasanikbacteria bacterium RIFOXYD2_FULL_36_9 TaxID=1798707 RepID=A0A1F6NXM8_9BACT|nr:MAG: tRNA (guanine-N1)-methyltransferase [uncultured bacterium]OGH88414.1 MAG: tRNA (guanosine(37)-N1)-methyltransferase TrmD [Candidatus Magasanikbacteria bacterium RIFOXYD2_FULL_36_9]